MSYVYIKTEPKLWTVGFYKPDGHLEPESDHASPEAAAARAAWFNGGKSADAVNALSGLVAYIEELYHDDLQCDHEVNLCGCSLKGELRAAREVVAQYGVKEGKADE